MWPDLSQAQGRKQLACLTKCIMDAEVAEGLPALSSRSLQPLHRAHQMQGASGCACGRCLPASALDAVCWSCQRARWAHQMSASAPRSDAGNLSE